MKSDKTNVIHRLKSKAAGMTKKQKLLIAGVIGGIIVLGLISWVVLTTLTNAATSDAKAYQKEVDSYVNKLNATNKSINQLKPIVGTVPKLKQHPFGWMSEEYEKAESTNVIVSTFYDEALQYIPKYKTASLDTLFEERRLLNAKLVESVPDSAKVVSAYDFDDEVKRTTDKSIRRTEAYTDMKNVVEAYEGSAYDKRVKDYTLSLINASLKSESEFRKDVKAADTLADIRGLNKKQRMQMFFPEYDPNYGIAAISSLNSLPANTSYPAVVGLKYALDNNKTTDKKEARDKALATVHGYTAAFNIPKEADSGPVKLNKLGNAAYSLERLSRQVASSENEALKARVARAKAAYGSLPFGSKASSVPSGLSRMATLSELNGQMSDYDGYADLLVAYRNAASRTERLKGARVDFEAYDTIRKFAESAYPTALYPNEVKAYQKAISVCTGHYRTFHKDTEKVIEAQLKQALKVSRISDEVTEIREKGNASDLRRLLELRAQVRTADAEVTRLQKSLAPANEAVQKGFDECGPDVKKANEALNPKLRDLPGLYIQADRIARQTYQK